MLQSSYAGTLKSIVLLRSQLAIIWLSILISCYRRNSTAGALITGIGFAVALSVTIGFWGMVNDNIFSPPPNGNGITNY